MSIPRLIHQTWKTHAVPAQWQEAQESWVRMHPEWSYRFWTDDDLEELVRERAPELASLFRGYPDAIQRVDASRYVILREFGGVYADLDIQCVGPLDPLLEGGGAVLAPTKPLGVSNDLMISEAGHPLFRDLVEHLEEARERWSRWWMPRHFRILLTTGSLFLSSRAQGFLEGSGIRFLSQGQYGHGAPEEALVRHLPGNSWAGWDTHLFLALDRWVGRHVRRLARGLTRRGPGP